MESGHYRNVPALQDLASESFCYVTTRGRRTGKPHTIEIWFGVRNSSLYLLAGGGERADWVRNMRAEPVVRVRFSDEAFEATARFVLDEDEELAARRLLAAKYQGWEPGRPLSEWARSALVVALDPSPHEKVGDLS